eukprot:NODE_287_length_10726_cov_0.240614.p6 type:complete len:118 gc:universal NODE_287_length_10726_cov_0.240614:7226-7579(+)
MAKKIKLIQEKKEQDKRDKDDILKFQKLILNANKKVENRIKEVEAQKKAILLAEKKAKQEAARAKEVIIEKQKEKKIQEKLKHIGHCPVGYHWIKSNGGYRCAGGSHFVSDSQINKY